MAELRTFQRSLATGADLSIARKGDARPPPPPPPPRGPSVGSAAFWENVKETFVRYDRDASSTIDAKELREALRTLGMAADSHQAEQILGRYDEGGRGSLSLDEFRRLVAELRAFEASGGTALPTPAWEASPHAPPEPLYSGWDGPARTIQSKTDDYEGKVIL